MPHAVRAGRRSRTSTTRSARAAANSPGPWGVSKSRNITSSKTAGIGDWTDAEIKTAITQGKRKDGTPLKGPMGYQYYAKMTDADLDAVIAYLRTRAGEGIAPFSAPAGVSAGARGWRAAQRPSIAAARGLYLGSIDWDPVAPCLIA